MRLMRCLLVLALLLAPGGGLASAQSRTGTVFGVVADASGAVVPGASVVATEQDTAVNRETVTDERGRFEFLLLPIGRYTIAVTLQGFATSEAKGVTLETQQNREVNLTLHPVGVQESVTVSGTAQIVEVDRRSAALGQVINSTQVAELPLNGRNFVQLGWLTPGAVKGEGAFFNNKGTTEVSIRGTTSISVQGMRENANDFLIDGIDNNELTAGAVSILPSVESIQEFKVMTNSYSAEYGSRGGGTVLVSTKSGTNSLHGSAFEFLRNDAFDSKNYFETEKGKFNQNQFGGSLGGPIVKSKTFFFADYMGFFIDQAQPVLATVPTLKMRNGDFTESLPGAPARLIYDPATTRTDPATGRLIRDPFPNNQIPANRLDPIALKLLALYPLPTYNDRLSGNFLANPVKNFRQNYINSRIDHNLSQNDAVFARATFDHATQYYPYAFDYGRAGTYSTVDYLTKARNIAASETHIFSSKLLNQVTGGFNMVYNDMTPIGEGKNLPQSFGIPGANLGDAVTSTLTQIAPALGFTALGDRVFTPFTGGTKVWHFTDALTWTNGPHTLKTGGSIRLNRMETLGATAYAGAFAFDQFFTAQFGANNALNAATGSPIASLLLGLPASGNRSQAFTGYTTTRLWEEYRGYIDDSWQVNGDLTLNLGLAYNLTTPQREAENRMANFLFDTGQFVNASDSDPYAGVKTDKNNFEPRLGFAWSPGESKRLAIRGGYGVFHDVSANGGVQGLIYNPPFISELGFTSDSITPVRTLQTGFPVFTSPPDPKTYAGNLYLNELDMQQGTIQMWNMNVQQEFFGRTVWTFAYAGTAGRNIQSKGWNLNSAPPGPGFNTASRRPYPQYNTFNAIIGRGTIDYNSFQLKAEKRYSQGSYFLVAYTYGKAMTNGAGQNVGVGQGVRYYPYLPLASADDGRSDTDVRHNFNASVIGELPFGAGQRWLSNATGATEAILGNWQVNGIVRARSGLPLALSMGSNQSGTALGNRPDQTCSGELADPTAAKWFDTSCFVAPAVGVFGNAPRTLTSVSGPGLFNVDLSIFKNFSVAGSTRLQFRWEIFNLFNNVQFANPGTTVGNADFGQILSTINPARQMQFALKFEF